MFTEAILSNQRLQFVHDAMESKRLQRDRSRNYMLAFDSVVTSARPLLILSGAISTARTTNENIPSAEQITDSLATLYSSAFKLHSQGIPKDGLNLKGKKYLHTLMPPNVTDYSGVRRRSFPVRIGNGEFAQFIKVGSEFFPREPQVSDFENCDDIGEERYWLAWNHGNESYCLWCRRNFQFDDLGAGQNTGNTTSGAKAILTRTCTDGTRMRCVVDQNGIALQGDS